MKRKDLINTITERLDPHKKEARALMRTAVHSMTDHLSDCDMASLQVADFFLTASMRAGFTVERACCASDIVAALAMACRARTIA